MPSRLMDVIVSTEASGIQCLDNLQSPVVLSTVEAYTWEGRPTSSKAPWIY